MSSYLQYVKSDAKGNSNHAKFVSLVKKAFMDACEGESDKMKD